MPLAHQPGEVWEYGLSTDVLGRVVEVASGEPLDQFLQNRIFAPLHMVDTGFYVPEAKLGRLVEAPMPERPPIWDVDKPAKLFSGGGGLVSTAPDYLRFCQMLLNGGELDGARVLKPESGEADDNERAAVRYSDLRKRDWSPTPEEALGLASPSAPILSRAGRRERSEALPGPALWGTFFWIDPAEKLIGLQMIQAAPGKGREAVPFAGINRLVYGALTIAEPSSFAPQAAPTILSPKRSPIMSAPITSAPR